VAVPDPAAADDEALAAGLAVAGTGTDATLVHPARATAASITRGSSAERH
jgi:hypothetical protein